MLETIGTSLKRSFELVTSPLGIMNVVMFGGCALWLNDRRSRWGVRLLIVGTGLYLLVLFSPLTDLLIRNLELDYPPLLTIGSAGLISHVVVLPGSGELLRHVPITSSLADQTIWNAVEGIRLYRQLPRGRLVISGGSPTVFAVAEFARTLGVPPQDITTAERADDTYVSVLQLKPLVGDKPFIIVATAWDLRRVMAVARKAGMHPIAAPAGIWTLDHFPAGLSWSATIGETLSRFGRPDHRRLIYLQWAYHEHLGYLWYWLLGRV